MARNLPTKYATSQEFYTVAKAIDLALGSAFEDIFEHDPTSREDLITKLIAKTGLSRLIVCQYLKVLRNHL